MSTLCRLMPNVCGPSEGKRCLFMGVMQSVLLYGAPSLASTTLNVRNADILQKVHRLVAIKCASAYHAVSCDNYRAYPPLTSWHSITEAFNTRKLRELSRLWPVVAAKHASSFHLN